MNRVLEKLEEPWQNVLFVLESFDFAILLFQNVSCHQLKPHTTIFITPKNVIRIHEIKLSPCQH